jgi:3-phosphoshikimate 1-carboxyvinyltransferase
MTTWSAPLATGPVTGTVTMPGSKSLTNRLLLLAALADGPSLVSAPLHSRDSTLMVGALRALGTTVVDDGADWIVTPGPWRGPVTVDVGNAGTAARFLTAAAGLADGEVSITGDERMRERPLASMTRALRVLGSDVRGDAVPLTVSGTGRIPGGEVTVDASQSSQLLSGLLLAAPRFDRGAVVHHVGPPVPSAPHLEMTVACLRDAGIEVEDSEPDVWRVSPGVPRARDAVVEPDLSSASAFLGAAAVTGGAVTVTGWPATTTQPGRLMPALLEAFGCTSSSGVDGLLVRGPEALTGADLDVRDHNEAATVLAVLAVCARTPSRLRGIGHLRGHETDRLRALVEELSLVGAKLAETDDGLVVEPADLHAPPRPLDPRADHRLAMAYAVLGLVVPGVAVDDIETVGKTVPGFTSLWAALVA